MAEERAPFVEAQRQKILRSYSPVQRRVESDGDVSAMATIVNRHMSQRRIDDAVKLCVRAAESGNLNSIAMLGLMFFQNQGEEWQGDAFRLSVIAAKLGSPIAHFALGGAHVRNGSVAIGVQHLACAAEGGHTKRAWESCAEFGRPSRNTYM